MRKLIKKSAGWIHTSLILAIILPLLYAFVASRQDTIGQHLYFKCLVIAFPVILTDLIVDRCKGLLTYLFLCILIFAATAALGWCVAGSLRRSALFWVYIVLLLGETIFVVINRLLERIQKQKEAKAILESDPQWHPSISILREPSFWTLLYFLAVYIIAINLDNPSVCNAALFSAAIYTLITFLYQYVRETDHYLSLNKRTCNLPSKRIYGIGSGMMAIFLLVLVLIMLPAFFTVSGRHYRDLRELTANIEMDYTELIPENDVENASEDPMATLIAEYGEPRPTPQWLIALSYVMEAAVFLFLIMALLKKIYATFRDFHKTTDENGDIVEELTNPDEHMKFIKKVPSTGHHKLSEQELLRKNYRKVIRRHRKDRPAVYESPIEIETNAGIADNEEIKELHKNYELARYGKDCHTH